MAAKGLRISMTVLGVDFCIAVPLSLAITHCQEPGDCLGITNRKIDFDASIDSTGKTQLTKV